MDMIVAERPSKLELGGIAGTALSGPYIDPLDHDDPEDDVVVTTRRAICRVALVAAEAAGRFQREAVRHDAMTWMLAPRILFNGAPAIEACLRRDDCLRGVLIHGLSLGLDADPALINALASDDDDDLMERETVAGGRGANVLSFPGASDDELRLFTATVVAHHGDETIQAFHASLATDKSKIVERLHCRMGGASAGARIFEGFDPTDPLVAALVSDAISDTLLMIADQPASPIAAGLDLNIEQRFLS